MPKATSIACLAAALAIVSPSTAQQTPTPAAAPWWQLTTDLSSDAMQGRDTGSEAYQRAADYVAAHFKADGLKPAGDNGSYFQSVPMHQVDLDTLHSSVELVDANGAYTPLALLYDITLTPRGDLPALTEGPLVFVGYGDIPPDAELKGEIAVYFNNVPADLEPEKRAGFAAMRMQRLTQAGAIAVVSIDNPAATEPSHWPAAYARTVTIREGRTASQRNGPLALRMSYESAAKLFADTYTNGYRIRDGAGILANGVKGRPLGIITLTHKMRIALKTTEKDISSPNVIAVLPGSDPALAPEYVAVSAHLDGYGYGTPVIGDNLYNGALDDAAYVATLLNMADILHAKPPARSLLFCIFTGEEKGLLGSVFYTQHLTVPKEKIVADFNLDQLRPIFPLKILTMEGIADSTLGDTAKAVAKTFSIELRPDHETERRLFSRSDNYSFVRIGVPIGSFIFGYDPNTEEERIYRDWYARRYHKPQDDLATPIDWAAAVTFNDFYRALVLSVANNPSRPEWLPTSAYAPKP